MAKGKRSLSEAPCAGATYKVPGRGMAESFASSSKKDTFYLRV